MINAQQIYNYCRELNLTGISLNKDITEECKEPFHHLFELADKLKPIDIGGERRFLWVKANRGSFEEYCKYHKDSFTYYQGGEKSGPDVDAMKKAWPVVYPDEEEWFGLMLVEVEGNRAIFLNNRMIIDVPAIKENKEEWDDYHRFCQGKLDVRPLLAWMESEIKNCMKELEAGTYMTRIKETLPYRYREGEILCKRYWEFYPEQRERTYGELLPDEQERFLIWYEKNKDRNPGLETFTSRDYFNACRVYYEITGKLKEEDSEKTSRELYLKYSDGRDGHLRDLEEDSAKAFAEWLEKGYYEHHVWELDYAHKWLRVHKRDGKYNLTLTYYDDFEVSELLPVVLAMAERGLPMDASAYSGTVRKIKGEGYLTVASPLFSSNWWEVNANPFFNNRDERLKYDERRCLRVPVPDEILKEVKWYDLPEVSIKDSNG